MRQWIATFTILLIFSRTAAQDISLPTNLEIISPENISEICEIGHLSDVSPIGLIWSPDNQTLAAGTSARTYLYDTTDLTLPPRIADSGYSSHPRFTPDGALLINYGQAWDTNTGELVTGEWSGQISASGHIGITTKEGEGINTIVEVWDIADLSTPRHTLDTGLQIPLTFIGALMSPDERTIAVHLSADWQHQFNPRSAITIQLWNIESGTLITSFVLENGGFTTFSPDGSWLMSNTAVDIYELSESYAGDLTIRDTQTGAVLGIVRDTTIGLTINPDSTQLAVTLDAGGFALWSESGQIVLNAAEDREYPVTFSPDGRWLISAAYDVPITVWDVAATLNEALTDGSTEIDGEIRLNTLIDSGGPIIFSDDGTHMTMPIDMGDQNERGLIVINFAGALASGSNSLNLEDSVTVYAPGAQTGHSFFSPDAHWLLANREGEDGEFLFNTATGEEISFENGIRPVIYGGLGAISSFFTADSRLFGQRTVNQQVLWWDTATFDDPSREPVFVQDITGWGLQG